MRLFVCIKEACVFVIVSFPPQFQGVVSLHIHYSIFACCIVSFTCLAFEVFHCFALKNPSAVEELPFHFKNLLAPFVFQSFGGNH